MPAGLSHTSLTLHASAGSLARTLGLTNQSTCLATSHSSLASSVALASLLSKPRRARHHRPKLPQFPQRSRNSTHASSQSRCLVFASGASRSTQPLHCGMSSPVARWWSSLSLNQVPSRALVCSDQAAMRCWIKLPLPISSSASPSSLWITSRSCQLEHMHFRWCGASSEA